MATKRIYHPINEQVSGATLKSLTVAPTTANVVHSATQQYTVTGLDSNGDAFTLAAKDIAWTISSGTGGTVSSTGLFTASSTNGTYQIRATHAQSGVYDESNAVVVTS